jgi:glycosyltransferase involved in cell wall biosynthesis
MVTEETYAGAVDAIPSTPPLKVWVGRSHPARLNLCHGQRNADLKGWPLGLVTRLDRRLDCVTLIPPGRDLIHAINAVPLLTGKPYIITFEDYCPRVPENRYVGWLEKFLRRRLLSKRCIALVAMSEFARRQFRHQHRDFDGLQQLEEKLQVIYPALPVRRTSPKKAGDRLRLLFVGRTFVAKGGPAVVEVHRRLRKQGIPVDTTIISFLKQSLCFDPPSQAVAVGAEQLAAEEGIRYYPGLPNDQVQQFMAEADYLLFPTLFETFGYVSLEAMAWGTPVIASRTCALPDVVVPGKSGFLLDFPNEPKVGKWIWLYRQNDPGYTEAYRALMDSMAAEMVDRLTRHWDRRSEYEELSAGALRQIQERFNPEVARDSIEKLYEKARRV